MSVGAVALVLVTGFGVGVFSALLGVGGGVLMVPFMVIALDLSQQVSEGTSLLVIAPTAVAGALSHRRFGYGSMRTGLIAGAGGVVGSFVGALIALETSPDTLRMLFVLFLAIMGARLILKGLREARAAQRSSSTSTPTS